MRTVAKLIAVACLAIGLADRGEWRHDAAAAGEVAAPQGWGTAEPHEEL